MAFDGSEGEFIEIGEASGMTQAWREGTNGKINAVFFGRDKLQAILDQKGCEGIRMYFAENDQTEKTLVLVGAEQNENDMDSGLILDRAVPCPTNCSVGNPLNS